jgi:AraC-like DNA-binding protein
MLLNDIKPSPFLAEFIRLYRIVDFHFSDTLSAPSKAYPPRPEHCLQFYPKDMERVTYPNTSVTVSNNRSTLIGQHTIVNTRHVGKEFVSLQVVFRPGALFRITGIKAIELANVYMDAENILGLETRLINEKLFSAKSYEQMIAIIELYLGNLIKKVKREQHPIDLISMEMMQSESWSLDTFIKQSFLCHRQFDRKFLERVGISPKQYLQVIRFDKAFRMKNRYPDRDWLTIALHCGYYDYQHLAKEYKEFTGYTPNAFADIESKAPERAFGDIEV